MNAFSGSSKRRARRRASLSIYLLLVTSFLAACGTSQAPGQTPGAASPEPSPETPKSLTKATVVLNWFPEPEHGGNYAALAKGFYKEAGLDMTLMPGGPQVSSTQIVASGKAEFGMANGDDILVARGQGIPIVAIATAYQKSPQALFYHKSSGIQDFSDLNGHKVYVASTASYWQFLKSRFKLDQAQEMRYTGSLVNFVNDPNAVTQGYVTSETYTLTQEGVDFGILLNADSGYNIYAGVYFTTEKMIAEQPELVKAFVEATVKGWDYYKDHAEEINPSIQEKNPDMSLDMMKFSAEKGMDFAFGGDAATMGTGIMTAERWSEVQKQLVEVGVLKEEEPIEKVFTTEFLPAKK